ncbi:MAG: 2-isopropylmalate synthase [Bacteroides sp. SM23_62_1]|nr:MAG: 2-isopropylmalate synthase [Bacteroides sp. SM23_62_1]
MRLEIMDTTLRDGEQTTGVSFNATEKLNIARLLLEEVKIDRIEVASARVSEGEFEAVRKIVSWAGSHGYIDRVEILGFIDGKLSLDWISKAGGKVVNLLSKGSLKHAREQLRKTPDEHLADIRQSIRYARSQGIKVNLYLEDWSNGMIHSRDYVFYLMDGLVGEEIERFMLPDTLGILNQDQTFEFCRIILERYPDVHMDFHAHNDYDLAVANVFAAVRAGVHGIHTTVNGLGERAGNVPLSSVVAVLNDHLKVENGVDESKLTRISRLVESFSGIRISENKPLIGANVFTQTCGVHADGDSKNNLYYNDLLPERFGRVRKYALGKTSGKANIKKNLEELGLDLDPETMRKVTERVIELGDRKEDVTTEDLPYIISDVLEEVGTAEPIRIRSYSLTLSNGLRPMANICLEINDHCYEENAVGDGQYDAFMKAIWKVYHKLKKDRPVLVDYVVTIPPGGKTDALVATVITWNYKGREFKTRGLQADQTEAAIKATEKMLNIIERNHF